MNHARKTSILEKMAGSRWREEIRRGNVHPSELPGLGIDPVRENEGLLKGNTALAKRYGMRVSLDADKRLGISPVAPEDLLDQVKGNRNRSRVLASEFGALVHQRARGKLGLPSKDVVSGTQRRLGLKPAPSLNLGRLGSLPESIHNLAIRHEIDEVRASVKSRNGKLSLRTTRPVPQGHASPHVLMEEAGHLRFLGPQVATIMRAPRGGAGSGEDLMAQRAQEMAPDPKRPPSMGPRGMDTFWRPPRQREGLTKAYLETSREGLLSPRSPLRRAGSFVGKLLRKPIHL